MMQLDRLLYRILTGSWGRFDFRPGPVHPGRVSVPDPVGIYVHIPFCRSICPFCPYNKMLYESGIAARYSRCLDSEANGVISRLGGVSISGVYFGGGTPMTLPGAVESLTCRMRPHLVPDAHVAVEVHPDDVTPAMVSRLSDVGVNMVSLGVQSLDDRVLKHLGRSHDSAEALAALDALSHDPGLSVNVDLMTGIPGQSTDSSASDMLRLCKRGVAQVSAYPLMDFPFTQMRSRLSLRQQCHLLDVLSSAGVEAGYRRSSVWTWTKPGSPKYTSITRDAYFGIGAGAASKVGRHFWLNTFSVKDYIGAIAGGEPAVSLNASLGDKESALYWLFWRCYEGEFDLGAEEALDIPILPSLVDAGQRLGLVRRESSVVHLTGRGLFLYHLLERYYTRRYIGRLWQSCREAAFPPGIVL